MASLKKGERIPLMSGDGFIEVDGYIAEGGQGEVYLVKYNGQQYALKWYSKIAPGDSFYNNLAHNIKMGAPNEYYLWPLEITSRHRGTFGYIMKLRPQEYREYGDFLIGDARFSSWNTLFSAALNIVESFFTLHSRGYSYQDLNEGSFFINPVNGDVLICDNDNVAPFGDNLGVKGMPKYMAPEVVLDKARPSTHTDRFSLAVILFRLFYIDHPLEGRNSIQFPLTDAIGAQLFGEKPVFIYDPKNESNRPDSDAQPNVILRWPMFPPDIRAAFTKSFTDGLKDINRRITEVQWKEILVKARGMLVKLNGKEKFVNCYQPKSLPDSCRILRTEEQLIALAPDSLLYSCQTSRTCMDYAKPVAMVKASTSNKNVLGLGNLSDDNWVVTVPEKGQIKVEPKGFVPLLPGIVIDFGSIKGKVF